MQFNLVTNDGFSNITVFHNGQLLSADSNHPNFQAILAGVLANDESAVELFDITKVVSKRLESLSERVLVSNGRIYFDGDQVDNALTSQILYFLEKDVEDWEPLVNFWEKLAQNPNAHSREQLYRWLQTHDFSITFDGDIVAYKGVNLSDGQYLSVHSGGAFVDGEWVAGRIPNKPGTVITMPRSDVQHDPSQGCHTGLHAGTWGYASTFADIVLKVYVNPRDVVSVPTDCNDTKMRTARYTVVEVAQEQLLEPVDYNWNDDNDDYCDYDDDDYY